MGVTWEAVRLLSHGSCLQPDLRGGGVLERSLCKRNLAVFFHVAPPTSSRSALTKQPVMEIPAINLKVSLRFT